MIYTKIQTTNFRNLFSQSINIDRENIVLYGKNGQGKTNLLEALYILCYGSSFRTSALKECIKTGSDGFSVIGEYLTDDNEKGKIVVSYYNQQRKIYIDGREIKDRKELIYSFPCIILCHEDINYIKGEPEYRRRFFDQMMSLYSPQFLDNLRFYKTILYQRNAAIKLGNEDVVRLYNERLAYYGLSIINEREKTVEDFNKIFPSIFKEVSETDFELSINYQPSWKEKSVSEIVDTLNNTFERDIKMNTTTSGPHRDKFNVISQYGIFNNMGSTGQIRLCSLIFRIAESLYFTKMTGKKPILLVDDVLLELDSKKRGKILSSFSSYSQAFFTFLLDENYNENLSSQIRMEVKNGEFYAG